VLKGIPIQAMSPHEPGLREALLSLDMTGEGPGDIVLIGVIPHIVELDTELTEPVTRAMPKLIDSVFAELLRLGVKAAPKESPSEPDLWWRRRD
jgi:hydrogenase maturation protease